MRSKFFIALVIAAAILALPVLALAAPSAQTAPVTVTLNALNNSGETGTATLTDLGNGQTKVDITITGEPADADQPVHIHNGTCTALGQVVYPLTNVKNGTSTTTVQASLSSLQTGNFAINGHKSTTEMTTYVFCGNIPASAAAAQATTTTTAEATATTAATTAPTVAATATTAATTAAATTPEATSTAAAPTTAPTTGGEPGNLIVPLLLMGVLALAAGLLMRRAMSR